MSKPTIHFQRYEFKYYLPKAKADKLIPTLLKFMEWDPYVKNGIMQDAYRVNSLYFDSPDFGCFFDKESGISDRKKLRLRYYNTLRAEDKIFAEIKRKMDTLVVKDRVVLDYSENLPSSLGQKLQGEMLWFYSRNSMRPKLFISYDRKPLIGNRDKNFRVTFDYNIMSALTDSLTPSGRMREVYPEGVVLELKYNNTLPSWFHKIIQKYQLQRLAYSKYCNALRTVVPEFEDNNYIII